MRYKYYVDSENVSKNEMINRLEAFFNAEDIDDKKKYNKCLKYINSGSVVVVKGTVFRRKGDMNVQNNKRS